MHIPELHSWDLPPKEARALQQELADRIKLCPLPEQIRYVAGADLSFHKPDKLCFGAVVVLELPQLETVETLTATAPLTYPYIPGLLTFREGPVLIDIFSRLEHTPDVVIFDGQGIAHPLRMGLGAHMGLWLNVPTVGCAKSRLVGEHDEPDSMKGSHVPLKHEEERIGDVVRTRTDVRPVFVSPGHLADFRSSRELVLRCAPRYKLPEPTRRAHLAVSRFKKEYLGRD
jgi:deoxyribonuclease V